MKVQLAPTGAPPPEAMRVPCCCHPAPRGWHVIAPFAVRSDHLHPPLFCMCPLYGGMYVSCASHLPIAFCRMAARQLHAWWWAQMGT